jgi:phosphoribosylformylglycinamidine cyclo-ligase
VTPESAELTLEGAGVSRSRADELIARILPMLASTDVEHRVVDAPPFAAAVSIGDRVIVATTDGVGTKRSLMRGRMHDLGRDLVANNVNDVAALGARPLAFLDYLSCGSLELEWAQELMGGMVAACLDARCILLGGETAEHPGIQSASDIDLAGFAFGVTTRDRLVTGHLCRPGDAVVGVASAGPHASGFSLIRHAHARVGATVSDDFLAPTTVYSTAVAELCDQGVVKALANICDGGVSENIVRGLPARLGVRIDSAGWPLPAWVTVLTDLGCALPELRRSVNMGIGYALVVEPSDMAGVVQALRNHHLAAWRIGEVTLAGESERVEYA